MSEHVYWKHIGILTYRSNKNMIKSLFDLDSSLIFISKKHKNILNFKRMQKHSLPFTKTLPIAFLPLFAAGIVYVLQASVSYLTEIRMINHDQAATSKELGNYDPISLVLQQLIGIYDNCTIFVVVMMILNFMIHHYKQISRKTSSLDDDFEKITPSNQDRLLKVLTLILCYIINFYLLKLLVLILSTCYASFPLIRMDHSRIQTTEMILPSLNQRKLSEESQVEANKLPAFMEVIHESFHDDLVPYHVLLRNDFRIAFVVQIHGLAIYNISEPAGPRRIYFLDKSISGIPSAVLSPKNRFLFIDSGTIQIFNVSDVQNPKIISEISSRTEQERKFKDYIFYPSVTISSDEKFAICTDPRMQIYDISNLSSPKLVWNQTWTEMSMSAILSADDRTAFIGRYKSLLVMNVTDFRSPKALSSYPISGGALASTLSKDEKTLYLLCVTDQSATSRTGFLKLHVLNITNLSSPTLLKQIDLGEIHGMQLLSIKLSPDETLLAVRNMTSLRILSLKDFRIFTIVPDSVALPQLAFAPNGNIALVSSIGMMRFVEFHYNLISEYSTSFQPNFVSSCELKDIQKKQISVASSNQRAFILAGNAKDTRTIFDIDLLNYSKPLVTQIFNFTSSANLFTLSSDGNNIYYKSDEKILQILSTQGQLSKVASIEFKQDFEQMFVISSDQKTLFALLKNYTDRTITIFRYDISVPVSPKLVSDVEIPSYFDPDFDSIYLVLSADEKTLFLLDQVFWIFDISDEKMITALNAFSLKDIFTKTFAFSPDYKTCFVITTPYLNKKSLVAIDLKNYSAPIYLSKIDLPIDSNYKLSISKDDRLLFLSSTEAFITVDISNKALIKISEVQVVQVSTFSADQSDQYILIGSENGLSIMNRSPKYSLYLHDHQFQLGGVYKSSLMVLELNQLNRYNPLERSYKFVQASLYSIDIKPLSKLTVSYPTLPNWINLDRENFAINLDLTLPQNAISYRMRFGVSTQVLAEDFLQIKGANFTKNETENLQVHLVTLGYLDTEQYLTPHFNTNTTLLLSSEYSLFEKEIRNILKSHSIELLTTISIKSSLELLQTKSLRIKTPSINSIQVTIELFSQKAQFVSQAFSAVKLHLNQEKTVLLLEGALLNINEALKELLINLEDGVFCEGNITITDGLNPTKVEYFKRISDFLKINQKPQMVEKYSLQSQVDSVNVKAGEHFTIEFDAQTFSDVNNRSLVYSLDMPEENMEVPGWITLRGRSLMGTPPEQFWPYKKQFCIIASNGEKSESVVFTLKIELSFVTILRRIMFLVGYLFTAYKAWKYSDWVYNILLKKSYQYSKILKIVPGKEISRENIFPIILISKEMENLSKVMLGALKIFLGERKAMNDQQFIEYFIDPNSGELMRQKLIERIETLLSSALNERKIFKYQNKNEFEKKVVQELIVNELTMKRIKSERATLEIFEKIKSEWIHLVEIDRESESSIQFILKEMNFIQELRKYDINETEKTTTEYSKLIPSKINTGLLKDAISAYAFNQQNLYINRYEVQIISKELVKQMKSSWRIFLKMNMVNLFENSMKQLGYGLKYKFIEDQIVFYGKLTDEMKDKTLVVQITTKGGLILREILIQGTTTRDLSDQSVIHFIQEEL